MKRLLKRQSFFVRALVKACYIRIESVDLVKPESTEYYDKRPRYTCPRFTTISKD